MLSCGLAWLHLTLFSGIYENPHPEQETADNISRSSLLLPNTTSLRHVSLDGLFGAEDAGEPEGFQGMLQTCGRRSNDSCALGRRMMHTPFSSHTFSYTFVSKRGYWQLSFWLEKIPMCQNFPTIKAHATIIQLFDPREMMVVGVGIFETGRTGFSYFWLPSTWSVGI